MLPYVGGGEIAGTVIEAGPGSTCHPVNHMMTSSDVTRVRAGDRVVGLLGASGGGFAQECVVQELQCFQVRFASCP